jgi:signal transduction histidine kinase
LQESLTNVHRHSGSRAVEVRLTVNDSTAALTVRDYGKGISPKLLDRFRKNGSNVGVGLAGIRERKELSGTLDIQSAPDGTVIKVEIPCTSGIDEQAAPEPGARFSASS